MDVETEYLRGKYKETTESIHLAISIALLGAIGLLTSSFLSSLTKIITVLGSRMFALGGALLLLCSGVMFIESIMTLAQPGKPQYEGPNIRRGKELIMGWLFGVFLIPGIFLYIIGAVYALARIP